MKLLDIYKAKQLGIDPQSLFAAAFGKSMAFEWVTESVPYVKRSVADGANVGSKCEDEIVGGSLAWNQRLKISDYYTESPSIFTINSDGSITANGKPSGNATCILASSSSLVINGHIYLMASGLQGTGSSSSYEMMLTNAFGNGANLNLYHGTKVFKCTYTGQHLCQCVVRNGYTASSLRFVPQLIDLTMLFGSTIAEYILSIESSKTGDGVAFFKKLFPKELYANSESLQSVNVSARITRDANDNIIGNYALDESLTLRGVPKIANGKLYYDGDTYASDGTVTRKYGIVDLGTCDWNVSAAPLVGSQNIQTLAKAVNNTDVGNLICAKYIASSRNNVGNADNQISINASSAVVINSSEFTGKTEAQVKTLLSGIYLVYELKTQTTASAEPYTNPQNVVKNGTEEYVDYSVAQGLRDVAIPVGHNTKYQVPV